MVGYMKNVILLTIDTLRRDALGVYGNSRGLSPFIDSIANHSIVFDKAHAIGPYTQVSFPGILTSSYYFDYGRSTHLSQERTLISEQLRTAEIVTAAFHSNPYVSAYFGWNRGWNMFRDFMEYDVTEKVPYLAGDAITENVEKWLSSHVAKKEYQRFFLWVHFMDVHEPYIPQKKYLELIDSRVELTEDEMFQHFKEVLLKRDVTDGGKVDVLKELYQACVRRVDDYVKQFFEMLERLGVLKDSLTIVTSDHGDEFGEHGGLSHDGKMFQELLAIPLLIFNPGIEKKQVCEKNVSNIDIPPTINHLFGLKPVEAFQGCSLLPADNYEKTGCFGEAIEKMGHKIKETDREVYYYLENRHKIIYRGNTDGWELYDLETDPQELNNMMMQSPQDEETARARARMTAVLKPRIRRWT
jgi:arylsulfatase A-like enzyme